MKKVLTIGALLVFAAALTGCSGGKSAAASNSAKKAADDDAMTQMVSKWHEAVTTKNVELAMTLFADDSVFTVGGQTYSGKEQIRKFFATQAAPFKPENRWISLTHMPHLRHSISNERGTLFFECHYFDTQTRQLTASVSGDAKVARLKGQWLFTNLVGGNAILG